MKNFISEVKKYYDENTQLEWKRMDRHPFKFIFTTYMIDQYVKPGDRILDIGGGPGRYSIYYAQKNCDVTLIDLSENNIAFAEEMGEKNQVSFQAIAQNCLSIDSLDIGEFDHVFMMGPLYHLPDEKDRETAVHLALKKLKPGGIFTHPFYWTLPLLYMASKTEQAT